VKDKQVGLNKFTSNTFKTFQLIYRSLRKKCKLGLPQFSKRYELPGALYFV